VRRGVTRRKEARRRGEKWLEGGGEAR